MRKTFTLIAALAGAASIPAMAAEELMMMLDWDNDDNRSIPVVNAGETVTIESYVEGGELPYTYRWVNGKGEEVGNEATLVITATLPESYRLYVTSADNQTVSEKANLFVNVPQLQVATFDDLPLEAEQHYAGDPLTEDEAFDAIFSGSFHFTNSYMPDWNYWCGYCYAAETATEFDASLGFVHQFRNVVGGGAEGTSNYGVSFMDYADTRIYVTHDPDGIEIPGMYVTNSSYLINSVLHGDGFCPAFSHDDNDYYNLVIEGLDEDNNQVGKVEVSLVDYSGETPYILSDWHYVDLTPLGKVCRLRLDRESTKQAFAPAYVCLDQIGSKGSTDGIAATTSSASSLRIAATADILSVLGTEEPWTLAVYAADGTLRATHTGVADSSVSTASLPAGIYIARIATPSSTATLRFLRP